MTHAEIAFDRCREDFPALARQQDGQPLAYFDGPGGTQVPRPVIEAITRYYSRGTANTHGQFATSKETDQLIQILKGIRFERIGKVVRSAPLRGADVVLEASPVSIGIQENGGALTLLHPHGSSISVNLQGSAGVRFVDADTDQVTTNRVYYAQ